MKGTIKLFDFNLDLYIVRLTNFYSYRNQTFITNKNTNSSYNILKICSW